MSSRVTRLLFAVGIMLITVGVLRLVLALPGYGDWACVLLGILLLALSTRGPWDSISSGRNRSVLGFRARAGSDSEENL